MTAASPAPVLAVMADAEALARRAAEWLSATLSATPGRTAVALSGGSTPRRLYELLAGPPFSGAFPWERVHWFWGDERFVPRDDPRSNYRMAREALLGRAPIPPGNIHPIPTEGMPPAAAAAQYEETLRSFYGAPRFDPARPLFAVTLLGLGPDGHTASLFPGSPVLGERERWVAAAADAKAEPRITLTYPALDSSRHAAFLVSGEEKRSAFERLRRGDEALPATHIHPVGALHWFADAAAAR